MSQTQAVQLASNYMRVLGPFNRSIIELDSRAEVNPAKLMPCRTARYAASAFPPSELAERTDTDKIRYSSVWIVPMCDGAVLRAMVSFSALADPNAVASDATKPMPTLTAAGFFTAGIDEGLADWVLGHLEHAVIYAATQTGAKVVRTPQLIIVPRSLGARPFWRIELDRTVAIETSDGGAPSRDSVIFVGGDLKQAISTGMALFAGVSDPTRQPRGERMKMAPVPAGLHRDPLQPLELIRVTKINAKTVLGGI